jgi:phosphate starvation-inducible protein PhoH and related proteins
MSKHKRRLLESNVDKNENVDKSPVVPQRDKLKEELEIKEFPWTPKQIEFLKLALDKNTKIIFLNGPAGTAKTLLSVYVGLKLLNQKKVSDIVYIRTIIESASKGLGSLPGEYEDKFKPFILPLEDKLNELLKNADINKLLNEKRVSAIPVNYLRGSSFNVKFLFADESQNFDFKELTTLITRVGEHSKLIVSGDSRQSDINGRSGFKKMFDLFNDEESKNNGIYCVEFGIEDVMRSGVVKFILEKIEQHRSSTEPMFPTT